MAHLIGFHSSMLQDYPLTVFFQLNTGSILFHWYQECSLGMWVTPRTSDQDFPFVCAHMSQRNDELAYRAEPEAMKASHTHICIVVGGGGAAFHVLACFLTGFQCFDERQHTALEP